MGKFSTNKPSGRYLGRVFNSISHTSDGPADVFSATVVYVDEHGVEHATGYEHPRVRSPRSMPWAVRKAVCQDVSIEIGLIARDFGVYLRETGNRFEVAHPDWWAPGVVEQPPYWADDDQGDLRAA